MPEVLEKSGCPFCSPHDHELLVANAAAVAFFDQYPVSLGHPLIVPRRQIASVFDLAAAEADEVWRLVAIVPTHLAARFSPDGFNFGVNDGQAAGQTVAHAHVHVIPRYLGNVPDPRGVVRLVIPSKADYWSAR